MPAPGRPGAIDDAETGQASPAPKAWHRQPAGVRAGLFSARRLARASDAEALAGARRPKPWPGIPGRPRQPARRHSNGGPRLLQPARDATRHPPRPLRRPTASAASLRAAALPADLRPLPSSPSAGGARPHLAAPPDARPASARRLLAHPRCRADGLVPFHKLCQWLAYSLIEPFAAGRPPPSTEIDGLTGLAGIPQWRPAHRCVASSSRATRTCATRASPRQPPRVVEWRALTVALLDELAPRCGTPAQRRRPTSPCPACWKAAPGPPAARSPHRSVRAAHRLCRSSSMARSSEPGPAAHALDAPPRTAISTQSKDRTR